MSNEVVEFIKGLWTEIKALSSDFKGAISMVNEHSKKVRSKAERELINIIKNRKIVKKPLVNKQEIIVRHKGVSNRLTNLLLLYLCIFNTLVVLGVLSALVVINSELPVNELKHYVDSVVDFLQRCDEVECADRLIAEIKKWGVGFEIPLTPYKVSDYLVNESEVS